MKREPAIPTKPGGREWAFPLVRTAWFCLTILALAPGVGAPEQTISLVGQMGGYCQAVHVQGHYAYIGEEQNFTILDVADPTSPVVQGRLRLPHMVVGLAVSGRLAYVANQNGGLKIVDVSDPSSPTLRGSYGALGLACNVQVVGSLAYVGDYFSGLAIIDVSDPSSPTLRGTYRPVNGGSPGMDVQGNYAYITSHNWSTDTGRLEIVDVSNPSAPMLRGSFNFDTQVLVGPVHVWGGFAYVSTSVGLLILDVSNPSSPVLRSTIYPSDNIGELGVSNNTVYAIQNDTEYYCYPPKYGLLVADVSDPSHPRDRGSYNFPDPACGVHVSGGLAYVAAGRSGLWILRYTPMPPLAPSGLLARATGWDRIQLWWRDNSQIGDGFEIERRTGLTGVWTRISTVTATATDKGIFPPPPPPPPPPPLPTYEDGGLQAGITYYYRVRAYNTTGFSPYSNVTSATIPLTWPAPPTGLTASANSTSTISLAWHDNSNCEDGFRILRNGSQITTVAANVTTYRDTGLAKATTYRYRVAAYSQAGSSYSNETSATTMDTPPAAPANLAASSVSGTQIRLTWSDASDNELGFKIVCMSGFPGSWIQITTVTANVTTYLDTRLTSNTAHWYRVCAYNSGGDSSYSAAAFCVTLPRPTNLTATAISYTAINLSWRDNSISEEGFAIERKRETYGYGSWSQIASVGPNVTTYHDTGLTTGTFYFYRVRAFTSSSYTPYSNEEFAATWDIYPLAPSNLAITAASSTTISLAWRNNSHSATGVKINRWSGPPWDGRDVASLPATATTFRDTGLSPLTPYYYRVRAYNPLGESNHSNEVSTTTLGALAAPSNLRATAYGSNLVVLWWRDNSTDEIGFRIERRIGRYGSWIEMATVEANVRTHRDADVSPEMLCFYRVRAYKAGGPSAYSNEASILMPPIRLAARPSWSLYR